MGSISRRTSPSRGGATALAVAAGWDAGIGVCGWTVTGAATGAGAAGAAGAGETETGGVTGAGAFAAGGAAGVNRGATGAPGGRSPDISKGAV